MKTLTVILFLLFASLTLQSQSTVGIESGINLGNVSTSFAVGDDTKMRTGFHAGVNIEAEFSDDGSFIFGLNYSQKGNTAKNEISTITQKLDYIEIPVTINFKVKGRTITPVIGAGFYFGFRSSAKHIEEYNTGEKYEYDNGEQFKGSDFGFLFNAGINYRVSKLIQIYTLASYYFGTKNVLVDELEWFGTLKNKGPRFAAGLKLSID